MKQNNDSKELYDIIYMIDSTGSMETFIQSVKEQCIEISQNLQKEFPNMNILYGGIFYRDPVDVKGEKHDYQQLDTSEKLKKKMENVYADGGGDCPEDWVGAFKILLKTIKWRPGSKKLVFHMADAGAHGIKFSKEDDIHNSYEESGILEDLIKECAKNQISIIGYKIGEEPKLSFEQCKKIFDKNKDEFSYYDILEFPIEILEEENNENNDLYCDHLKSVSKRVTRDITKSTKEYIHFSKKI